MNQDCGCDGDCCQPAKKQPWMKIVFVVIVVAALAIASIKIFNQNTTSAAGTNVSTEKSGCCPQSRQDSCARAGDSLKSHSCCPKARE